MYKNITDSIKVPGGRRGGAGGRPAQSHRDHDEVHQGARATRACACEADPMASNGQQSSFDGLCKGFEGVIKRSY